jgi:hypothetical protein
MLEKANNKLADKVLKGKAGTFEDKRARLLRDSITSDADSDGTVK